MGRRRAVLRTAVCLHFNRGLLGRVFEVEVPEEPPTPSPFPPSRSISSTGNK